MVQRYRTIAERDLKNDDRGRPVLSPAEKCAALETNLYPGSEDAEGHVWDLLNYIRSGAVPKDWVKQIQQRLGPPTPLAILAGKGEVVPLGDGPSPSEGDLKDERVDVDKEGCPPAVSLFTEERLTKIESWPNWICSAWCRVPRQGSLYRYHNGEGLTLVTSKGHIPIQAGDWVVRDETGELHVARTLTSDETEDESVDHATTSSTADRHLTLLGRLVRDRVTKFQGFVSSISFDLYGCIQAVVTPEVNDENKLEDSRWFDVARLEVIDSEPVMNVPDFERGPISEGKSGAAEKPPRATGIV